MDNRFSMRRPIGHICLPTQATTFPAPSVCSRIVPISVCGLARAEKDNPGNALSKFEFQKKLGFALWTRRIDVWLFPRFFLHLDPTAINTNSATVSPSIHAGSDLVGKPIPLKKSFPPFFGCAFSAPTRPGSQVTENIHKQHSWLSSRADRLDTNFCSLRKDENLSNAGDHQQSSRCSVLKKGNQPNHQIDKANLPVHWSRCDSAILSTAATCREVVASTSRIGRLPISLH